MLGSYVIPKNFNSVIYSFKTYMTDFLLWNIKITYFVFGRRKKVHDIINMASVDVI